MSELFSPSATYTSDEWSDLCWERLRSYTDLVVQGHHKWEEVKTLTGGSKEERIARRRYEHFSERATFTRFVILGSVSGSCRKRVKKFMRRYFNALIAAEDAKESKALSADEITSYGDQLAWWSVKIHRELTAERGFGVVVYPDPNPHKLYGDGTVVR